MLDEGVHVTIKPYVSPVQNRSIIA